MHFRHFLNSVKNNNIKEVKNFLKRPNFDPTQLDNIVIESSIKHNSLDTFKILIEDKRFNLSYKDNNALFYSLMQKNQEFFNLLILNPSVINSISKEWVSDNFEYFQEKEDIKSILYKIIKIDNF